jgi:hypothetical protein
MTTAACALLVVNAMAAEPYTGKTINLRLASPSPTGTNMVRGYEKLVEIVEAKSGGKVKIKLFANAVLGATAPPWKPPRAEPSTWPPVPRRTWPVLPVNTWCSTCRS